MCSLSHSRARARSRPLLISFPEPWSGGGGGGVGARRLDSTGLARPGLALNPTLDDAISGHRAPGTEPGRRYITVTGTAAPPKRRRRRATAAAGGLSLIHI